MDPQPSRTYPDSWRMFRIMGEFAVGFQTVGELPKAVAIFGSARTKPEHPHYLAAVEIGKRMAARGYTVITGGGPGIMEAGNKGAAEAKGISLGLCINLPFEQSSNPWISHEVKFHYFFVRKVMFLKNTCAIVVMPGGFGTMDEFFEVATLVQTHKIPGIPIVLYGRSFWQGLIDWMKTTMEQGHAYISPGDLDLFQVCDTPDEVMTALQRLPPPTDGAATQLFV